MKKQKQATLASFFGPAVTKKKTDGAQASSSAGGSAAKPKQQEKEKIVKESEDMDTHEDPPVKKDSISDEEAKVDAGKKLKRLKRKRDADSSAVQKGGKENIPSPTDTEGTRSPKKSPKSSPEQDKTTTKKTGEEESATEVDEDTDVDETPKGTTPEETPEASSDEEKPQKKIPTKRKAPKTETKSSKKTKTEKAATSSKSASTSTDTADKKSTTAQSGGSTSTSAGSKTEVTWKKGDPVPYFALCKVFEDIEATTKSDTTVAALSGGIGPEYQGKELGIGESILMKAIANASGRTLAKIKADVDAQGDLGSVAQTSKGTQRTMFAPKSLTVTSVFKTLKEIASITGSSSQSKKIDKITFMLSACKGSEPKYLIRSLEGKLRIGLAEQTVLVALAHAAVLTDPAFSKLPKSQLDSELSNAAATIKQVYNELPTYDVIVPALLEKGIKRLGEACKLTPGIPLKPMLAHPTKSLSEVLDRFEGMTFTCEYKYDGERAQVGFCSYCLGFLYILVNSMFAGDADIIGIQIHKLENGTAMVFSRNSENLSGKYPDILERVPKMTKPSVTSFVLDCEAVAWDREKNHILPFQVLSTRKRKDVTTDGIQVNVCVFAFDLLYLNGEAVTGKPLSERRKLLFDNFVETDGEFAFAKHMDTSIVDEIQAFLDDAVVGNCEGLMVKTLDKEASYEPSKRSRNWLKVKKDYLSGVGDTVDLVVIGAYVGRGKRTGVYGGFLLACYDDENEQYQSICKIGTGFSEENLAEFSKFFKDHVISQPKPYYKYGDNPNVRPDVWFDPVQVWEVKAADLSISPVHKAAIGHVDANKGISLRFPRFIRVRDDKSPEDATNAAQIAEMYRSQQINGISKDNNADGAFEY
ncbi:tRNA ligase [Quaeritorhiza haematococci]|nr:tRNA ligase [Quaeritorhiza haematococci]